MVARTADLRLWFLMISQMAEPICVKLSGVAAVWWASDLRQKKIFLTVKFLKKKKLTIFLKIFLACNLTLPHLCMRDDSLGFEDCRLATHLLN